MTSLGAMRKEFTGDSSLLSKRRALATSGKGQRLNTAGKGVTGWRPNLKPARRSTLARPGGSVLFVQAKLLPKLFPVSSVR
jgi:hypothetical protein